jgi:hypothetical protein
MNDQTRRSTDLKSSEFVREIVNGFIQAYGPVSIDAMTQEAKDQTLASSETIAAAIAAVINSEQVELYDEAYTDGIPTGAAAYWSALPF